MRLLLLFLDGVGLGEPDPVVNPWVRVETPALRRLLGRAMAGTDRVERNSTLLLPTDATLGVPGLPQSATGQTALLTGVNAPALVGRHVTAYPTPLLRDLLASQSLFARLVAAGRTAALANTYTPEWYAAVAARRLRRGAFTVAAESARVRLRSVDDLRRGDALFHDVTNRRPRAWGHDVPLLTPVDAGRNLGRLAAGHDLTVFEFFLSDLAAHGRTDEQPDEVVRLVDGLVAGVLEALGPDITFVLTSDHGNLEDDRSPLHTRNPVPTMVVGPARARFTAVRAITDVAPAILETLGVAA